MLNHPMGVLSFYRSSIVVLASLLTISPSLVLAAPDAGDILRQQPKPPTVAPAKKPKITPATPAEAEKGIGQKILVKGFRIKGAVLIPESELAALLNDFVGKELSFRQLHDSTYVLIAYYAQKGYLARVILPEQDIKDGIVTLNVIEGKRGNVRINSSGKHLDAARIERFIDHRLANGDAMNIANLGEALNILNEQPGIATTSSLAPGKSEGDIDLIVTSIGKPLVGYSAGINNNGSAGTGALQASGGISLSNPTGHFDAASLTANISDGNTYGRLDYSLAVGDAGLRLGANASHMYYHLTQSSFTALQATGTADTLGLTASYPLARRTEFNLSLTGSYDDKRLVDNTVAGETGNRHVTVSNLGVSGYTVGNPDSLLGSGVISFGGSYGFGNSDQRNAAALATDNTTRQVQGSFSKVAYNAAYLRPITQIWSFNATLHGQLANKNLDSGERFSLGGPDGVRAYPVGEASGDEGWLLSLVATDKLSDTLAANFFFDTGSVRLNRNTWADWNATDTNLPNTYQLSGLGAGVDWRISPNVLLAASIATPLGSNPGRDVNGMNSDGYSNHARSWLSLNAQF